MKVYTRRGDAGQTDLFGGERVGKDDLRVAVYGEVDELNAVLGLCAATSEDKELKQLVAGIQSRLFELGAYFATPDAARREKGGVREPQASDVEELEQCIDGLEAELEPLKRFILPGGTEAAASFHLARTVCRRAERRAVELNAREPLSASALCYLNRLSDLLFVLSRVENRRSGVNDVKWQGSSARDGE